MNVLFTNSALELDRISRGSLKLFRIYLKMSWFSRNWTICSRNSVWVFDL